METRKVARLLFFIFLFFFSLTAFADAPFLTDSAVTFEPRQTQIIFYGIASRGKFGNTFFAPAVEFDFGVVPDLEIDTLTPYVWNNDAPPYVRSLSPNASGISDIDIELKYRFIHETKYFPQVSIAPNFFIPTGNANRGLGNGRLWYYVPLVFEKNFGHEWRAYLEAGYAVNSAPLMKNYFLGGVVIQKNINKNLMVGAEIFSQGRTWLVGPPFTLANIGFVYNFTDIFSFQSSLGHSITGQPLWFSYAGFGFAFA